MLESEHKRVLGVEVWKSHGKRFSIESLNGWYCEGPEIREHYRSAAKFLSKVALKQGDVLTIQFK
jgi:hypothetical protein